MRGRNCSATILVRSIIRSIWNRKKGEETAWDYVEENPAFPRMLILGDSISRGYTLPVRRRLQGAWNVLQAPENCGGSHNAVKKLSLWMGGGSWDRITFNFGIHDRTTPDDVYRRNLEDVIGMLKQTRAELFWITTTPGAAEYLPGAVDRLNALAGGLMKEHGIPILDLHTFISPLLSQYQIPDNCHYHLEGYEAMGAFLISQIDSPHKNNVHA